LVDNLDLAAATGYDGARWEHFQIAHLEDDSIFRIDTKSRQIAWSWLSAAEAVANGLLTGGSSVFVSINLEEAKEKIRYAREVIGALPASMQPKLVADNRHELEFANGGRLLSLPATPPRGKARMNVYLDEYAHVKYDAAIYTAVLPMISRGNVRVRIGSSPLGASGRFWEIATESMRKYPGYTRKVTPWWEVWAFSLNVKEARRLAPALTTGQRVELFGNERIKAIYANMPEEDFQQEYECVFQDETTAWITWEEIKDVQSHELLCAIATGKEKDTDAATEAIDTAAAWVNGGQIEPVLVAGVDVGRTRNTTELFVIGVNSLGYPLRLAITLDNMAFTEQEAVIAYAMKKLPILGLYVDRNGIGRNLAENLEAAFTGRVAGMDFTNQSKMAWATDAKTMIQQKRTPLPVERELAYQIHSIKRTVTANRNLVFDTERNQKHHADKFWAWALALAVIRAVTQPAQRQTVTYEENVVISPF